MFFLTKNFRKWRRRKRKNTRKNTPMKFAKKKNAVCCIFFSSLFFSFSFSFLSSFYPSVVGPPRVELRIRIYSMSQGPEGGGGSFRVQSLMMTLEMYINTYIVVQRGPGNRLNRSFLLVIVEIIRDCGQARKEKLIFSFLDCGLFWVRGLPEGEGGMLTRIHTHIHIHIRQPGSCEDWSFTAPSGVCMYVYVCVCGTMQKWSSVMFCVRRFFYFGGRGGGGGVKRRCSE